MIKKYVMILALLGLIFFPPRAFSWGIATHAFIDNNIGKESTTENINEMYAGNGSDVFNYSFSDPYQTYLYFQTHNEFMKVWDAAESEQTKSLAYGFVSHNDIWGTDFTAHHSGITFGQDEGYIVAKAEILKTTLEQLPEYNALQLPDNIALDVCHSLVEVGVDILIKEFDPSIGNKIIDSAIFRNHKFPNLLVKAYAKDISQTSGISYSEAMKMIRTTELELRNTVILYGQALAQEQEVAIQLISEQVTELAEKYLTAYGITLPEGVDLAPLIKISITQSMAICADDLNDEIEETINFVGQQLNLHGISY